MKLEHVHNVADLWSLYPTHYPQSQKVMHVCGIEQKNPNFRNKRQNLSFQLKWAQWDYSIIYTWDPESRGRWVSCQASCVNTSSCLDKEELWLQNNSKTVNLTKPLGTGLFEVLATLGTGEWRTISVATNHHQAHMIPWWRPCVGRPLDYCSCGVASAAAIGQRWGAHVSKQGLMGLFGPASAKTLKGSIGCQSRQDPNTSSKEHERMLMLIIIKSLLISIEWCWE